MVTKVKYIADGVVNASQITLTTASTGDNTTAPATTAFVQQEMAALVDSSPSTLDTLNELAAALGDDPNFATTTATAIGLKAPIASPTFTGTVTATAGFTTAANTRVQASSGMLFVSGPSALVFETGAGTEKMRLTSTGLGIGTDNPAAKLEISFGTTGINNGVASLTNISGLSGAFSILHNQDSAGTGNQVGQFFGHAGSPGLLSGIVSRKNSGTWATNLDFYVNNLTGGNVGSIQKAMTIDSSGNVGIGTDAPGCALDITRTSGWAEMRLDGAAGGDLILKDDGVNYGEIYAGSGHGMVLKSYASQHMSFLTNADAAAKMTIQAGGNVGIGTDSPGAKLEISGKDDAGAGDLLRLQFDNSPEDTGITFTDIDDSVKNRISMDSGNTNDLRISAGTKIHLYGGTTNGTTSPHLTVSNGGNVGIGTDSPTQKLEVAGTALVENAKLKQIVTSNSHTATDVFVYDTRKDSDGGAWRKRTQHTSWYNEASGSNRSSRKEFPCVAVLAFNTNQELWIYDGDDPDLPVWAKYTLFTQDSGAYSSVKAKNGSIYASQAAATEEYSGNGHFQLNFVADYFFSNILGVFGQYKQGRADGLLTSYDFRSRGDRTTPLYPLTGYQISSIAVTVLPNAPIDIETGLPKVTLALACGKPGGGQTHGVSIIRDDDNVVDLTASTGAGGYASVSVAFNSLGHLLYDQSYDGGYPNWYYRKDIPALDQEMGPGAVWYSGTTDTGGISIDGSSVAGSGSYVGARALTYTGNNSFAVGFTSTSQKLSQVYFVDDNDYDGTVATLGTVVYTTSNYNTGHMVGDTKLATLSDTDATNVTGTELVTNGTFDSDVSGWSTNNGSTIVWNGSGDQTATVTSNGVNVWNGATQTLTGLVVGKTYILTADIITSNNWGSISFSAGANSGVKYGTYTAWNGGSAFPMKAVAQFTASATSVTVSIDSLNTTIATVTKVDNISVRLAEEDRSVNNKGLQVFGTITKTAVATGAELVSYGGFSRSNYLQQPYNSDLDFGTGDFSIMGWLQASIGNAGERQTILDRGSASLDSIGIIREYDGRFVCTAGSTVLYTTGTSYTSGNIHFILVRKSGTLSIYANGVLDGTVASTTNVTDTDAVMTIGVDRGLSASNWFTRDKLALLRISATAPTAEQITKMYNDEKHLFQENAQATLYGTSDAVTALAYDDDTNLLHVGTSAGRSVFQGLNRVDNTTDSVGAAISASNGLVAED